MNVNPEIRDAMLKGFAELDVDSPTDCDKFFEKYGAGNTIGSFDRQFERFIIYESLLFTLQQANTEKYKKMHKGTPFYFLGWLSFDLRNYEAATFYMSAALAEDRRKSPKQSFETWMQNPAGQFMSLSQQGNLSQITSLITSIIQDALNRFNEINKTALTVTQLNSKFIRPMIEAGHYSLATSFYSYILGYRETHKNLSLTAGSVDSIEPIIQNLFKGALLFESMLKYYYPKKDNGTTIITLGEFNKNSKFLEDFPDVTLAGQGSDTLQAIVDNANKHDYATTLLNTAKIRNTTSHKLSWDNIFNDTSNYHRLHEQEILAILYVIDKN